MTSASGFAFQGNQLRLKRKKGVTGVIAQLKSLILIGEGLMRRKESDLVSNDSEKDIVQEGL